MRRYDIFFLILLLLLTSCSSHTNGPSNLDSSEYTPTEYSDESVNVTSSTTYDIDEVYRWQLDTIYDNSEVWKFSDEDRIDPDWYCFYAITDFDQDGYLEVCKQAVYSNGPNTRMWLYEVTADMSLVRLESEIDEDMDYTSSNYPDFDMNEPIEYFQDENGVYYYLVHDCKSYGLSSVYNNYSYMALVDNRIIIRDVCYIHSENADEIINYYNSDGNEVSEEEYSSIYEEYIASATNNVSLGWFNDITNENIIDSFQTFIDEVDR
ncbi:MAG: hypothetical protein K6F49_04275 [Saccharofermentans sp.]|nr:hypothetical protein [Saccharofermentans sp.]